MAVIYIWRSASEILLACSCFCPFASMFCFLAMYTASKNCLHLFYVLLLSGISFQFVMMSLENQSDSYIWLMAWITMLSFTTVIFHFVSCLQALLICLKYVVSTCCYSHLINICFLSCTLSWLMSLFLESFEALPPFVQYCLNALLYSKKLLIFNHILGMLFLAFAAVK